MKTFSVAQGNVFLPIERPLAGGESVAGIVLKFSEDRDDSSQCVLQIIPPSKGYTIEAVFHRNGALMETRLLSDPERQRAHIDEPFVDDNMAQKARDGGGPAQG